MHDSCGEYCTMCVVHYIVSEYCTMCVVHYIVSEYCAHKIFTANTVYSNLIKRACDAMSYLSTQHLVHLNNQVEQLGLPPKYRNPRYSVSEIVYVTMVT